MAGEIIRDDPAVDVPRSHLSGIMPRVSWGAVWAGVMVALGMEILFSLFGFFIGFGMYNWHAANPWAGITPWTTVWYLVTAGWSMFLRSLVRGASFRKPGARRWHSPWDQYLGISHGGYDRDRCGSRVGCTA